MRLRDLIDLVEAMENRSNTFFHVTLTENLPMIMEKGLQPTIGDRSKKLGERSCVFLFPTRAAAEDGMNWLVDAFLQSHFPDRDDVDEDDCPPMALIEVILPPEIEVYQTSGIDWEYFTKDAIPPQCLKIVSRDF